MPKHYKEMIDEIINKMDEDAPANAVAHGGVDMAPNAGKRDPLSTAKPKKKDLEDIKKSLGLKVKEDNDNNNVVLKSIIENINKIEDKVDELSGFNKAEIKIEPEVKKPTFKEKFLDQLANNTPNEDQFEDAELNEKL
jgi:hypothetical protein